MSQHDQVWKELIWNFFPEFMQLFFYEAAQKLDFTTIRRVENELFTDLPEGERREPDLLIRVDTLNKEPELILVHIEVQAKRDKKMPKRMWEYYHLLRLRTKDPVFPLVLYLVKGTGGIKEECYTEGLFDKEIITFRYTSIGLPDLSAEEYLEKDNILAPALSVLMRLEGMNRVIRKLKALDRLIQAPVDEARIFLLTSIVEKYSKLTPEEQEEFNALAVRQEAIEMKEYVTDYEKRGIKIGISQGLEQGIEQGISKGIEQGISKGIEQGIVEGLHQGVARGKRESLLRLMTRKFGLLPVSIVNRINIMEDSMELDTLLDRVLDAATLTEMGV